MLYRSADGKKWEELKRITDDLGGWHGDWINGMLAYDANVGSKGSLYLRHRDTRRNKFNRESDRLARYDIASNTWSWMPTVVAMGHGTTVVNHYLYGIAHALGGNFGGPICRVDLLHPGPLDERTVLGPMKGSTPEWFSRAAQFATIDGKIYGIKNDWTTPQPKAAAEIGDRLFVFDPKDFAVSKFAGGDPWDSPKWASVKTPVQDLGPLPFEPGHGAALVALPPRWSKDVGRQGGLFIVAGCSPSNQEGFGRPSTLYAIYDIVSGKFRVGTLPGNTGHGTSAAFHKGKVYIKRGGMDYGPTNGEFWVATPARRRFRPRPGRQPARSGSRWRRSTT